MDPFISCEKSISLLNPIHESTSKSFYLYLDNYSKVNFTA